MHPILILTSTPFLVFWLWMFWDMTGNEDIPPVSKLNWTIAFLFLNVLAAGVYFIYFHPNRYS